jgi:queuine tRNA-ribosyltransferase
VDPVSFALAATSGAARVGRLSTPHGPLDTPAFFPVGTYGAVRGIAPDELVSVGVQGVLANTYHLHLRPGEDVVARLGGLHRFMGWSGPILTDSGGFQIHSLAHLAKRGEEGVRFRSPIDGSERFLTPEKAVQIQEALGSDLICVLDEFEPISLEPGPDELERARKAVERTARWAERGLRARSRPEPLLFGIAQGGGSEELRRESTQRTVALGFEAIAIGGLGVGDSDEQRNALLGAAIGEIPSALPRYLMGLGEPEDLVAAIERGVDLFDCVVPTRNGRHGLVFTSGGRLNLRNSRFREDPDPIEEDCPCPACQRHSRAYLRHLLRADEALGPRLMSLHNLAYYMRLLEHAREAIAEDRLAGWAASWRARYCSGGLGSGVSGGSSAATHSAA